VTLVEISGAGLHSTTGYPDVAEVEGASRHRTKGTVSNMAHHGSLHIGDHQVFEAVSGTRGNGALARYARGQRIAAGAKCSVMRNRNLRPTFVSAATIAVVPPLLTRSRCMSEVRDPAEPMDARIDGSRISSAVPSWSPTSRHTPVRCPCDTGLVSGLRNDHLPAVLADNATTRVGGDYADNVPRTFPPSQ